MLQIITMTFVSYFGTSEV